MKGTCRTIFTTKETMMCKDRVKKRKNEYHLTLSIWRAFSIMARNLGSDSRELAIVPGAKIFFSFILETATGSKSMKTSLHREIRCTIIIIKVILAILMVSKIPKDVPFA